MMHLDDGSKERKLNKWDGSRGNGSLDGIFDANLNCRDRHNVDWSFLQGHSRLLFYKLKSGYGFKGLRERGPKVAYISFRPAR